MRQNINSIDGHIVECTEAGVLVVDVNRITVLPRGTHAALDVLGESTKRKIVEWWKEVR
jgi:homogentisate 1,2-dioxygenase